VQLNIQPELEDLRFGDARGKNRATGLKNLEVTSMSGSYMSELLGFDDADNGECDPTTEEDIRVLTSDDRFDFDLIARIKQFIEQMVASDPVYMRECFSRLCPKDLKLLKNDMKVSYT
jgi:hypothetical protein